MLAVPNVSEGRDQAVIGAIAGAFAGDDVDVFWRHSDPDHHRTVYALRGEPAALANALARGASAAAARIDLRRHDGRHPRVGALDVAPLVHLDDSERGAAIAAALVAADAIGAGGTPVFLYGELGEGRTRAQLRAGGPEGLARSGLAPDFGPAAIPLDRGATLVAARPPLVAFNVELAPPATEADAKRIAADLRAELPGVKAIGLWIEHLGLAQVSTNIEDHLVTSAADVVAAVGARARVSGAELVAPAPRAAFADFPADVPLRGFDPDVLLH